MKKRLTNDYPKNIFRENISIKNTSNKNTIECNLKISCTKTLYIYNQNEF